MTIPINKIDIKVLETILDNINFDKNFSIIGDKKYCTKSNEKFLKSKGYTNLIMKRNEKWKEMSHEDNEFNKRTNEVRTKIEETFGLLKNHFGFNKSRYEGLLKVDLEFRIIRDGI